WLTGVHSNLEFDGEVDLVVQVADVNLPVPSVTFVQRPNSGTSALATPAPKTATTSDAMRHVPMILLTFISLSLVLAPAVSSPCADRVGGRRAPWGYPHGRSRKPDLGLEFAHVGRVSQVDTLDCAESAHQCSWRAPRALGTTFGS